MRLSRPLQRLVEVLDQIVGMFEPGGEADEAFADAELGTRFQREALMRGGGGMRDEALGVAQIVADDHKLERVLEAERRGLAALDLEATSVDPPRICFFTVAACG